MLYFFDRQDFPETALQLHHSAFPPITNFDVHQASKRLPENSHPSNFPLPLFHRDLFLQNPAVLYLPNPNAPSAFNQHIQRAFHSNSHVICRPIRSLDHHLRSFTLPISSSSSSHKQGSCTYLSIYLQTSEHSLA